MSWLQRSTTDHPFNSFTPPTPLLIPDLRPIAHRVLASVSRLLADKRPGVVRLVGTPGTGKTLIARRVAQSCRVADHATLAEISAISRLSGLDGAWDVPTQGECPSAFPTLETCWVPFRAPHHTISAQGLTGHGPSPGELHRAHGGILFLDQTHEFSRNAQEHVISALRSHDFMARTKNRPKCVTGWQYPARFVCVTSELPCPCGYAQSDLRACSCGKSASERHRSHNLIAQAFPDAPIFDLDAERRNAAPVDRAP